MKSFFETAAISILATVTLYAQSTTTQTNPNTQNTGQTSSAPSGMTAAQTPTGQPHTWTGVLIDANCQAIKSMKPAVSSSTSKKMDDTIEGTKTRESASSSQRTERTTTDGSQTTTSASRDEKSRTSESASGTDTATGTRARTSRESTSQSSSSMTSTGSATDPYPACHVTSSTSSFAVSSNGQVYFLDEASNARVRQQLQTDSSFTGAMSSPTSAPLNVVVMGNPNGPEITVTTLHKSR